MASFGGGDFCTWWTASSGVFAVCRVMGMLVRTGFVGA
jgi:hypothetical protein